MTRAPRDSIETGVVDVTDSYVGAIEVLAQSSGDFAGVWRQTGVRRANHPGGAFDRMSLRAVGLLWSECGRIGGRGAWEFVDAAGNRLFVASERTGDRIVWRITGGAGRYEGARGEGSYEDFDPYPEVTPGAYQQSPRARGGFSLPRRPPR